AGHHPGQKKAGVLADAGLSLVTPPGVSGGFGGADPLQGKTGTGDLQLLPPRPTFLVVQPTGEAGLNGFEGAAKFGSALMPFRPEDTILAGLRTLFRKSVRNWDRWV